MAAKPRKPRTVRIVEPPPSEPSLPLGSLVFDDPYDEEQFDDVTALNNVLSELGAGGAGNSGFISVFREKINPNNTKNEEYITRYDVADFAGGTLLEHLKNNFGAGRYHIRVYPADTRGLAANKWIDIAPDPKALTPAAPSQQPVDMSPVVQQIAALQTNFERMIAAMLASQPKQPSRMELLEEMRIMSEMFKPANSAPASQNYDPIALMKMGMEMAQMGGGGEANNNLWVSKMIDTFGKPLVEAFTAGQIKAPKVTTTPARAAIPAPENKTLSTVEEDTGMNLMLTGYIKMLAKAAANNADIADHADSILNVIPESQLPEFEAMLRAPDWQTKLTAISSAVSDYPVWFTNLRNTLIEFIDADKEEAQNLTPLSDSATVLQHETGDPAKSTPNDNPGGAT